CSGNSATCPTSCFFSSSCTSGHYCNGARQCVPKLTNGLACSVSIQCLSGFCVAGICCNSACTGCQACNLSGSVGTCVVAPRGSAGNPACTPYVCNGTSVVCPATCGSATDCVTGAVCISSQCVASRADGAVCSSGCDCGSGNCADGVCCDVGCSGCQACNLSGSVGACSNVPIDTDPHGACGAYQCDGTGNCLATCGGGDCSAN